MNIILHDAKDYRKEVAVDPNDISDICWLASGGGSALYLSSGIIEVDENPNHVGLIAGFIDGDNHCATGSLSGTRNFYWSPR